MENYTWFLERLKDMMDPNAFLSIIVTDRELALMNVITNVFPHATNLLFGWGLVVLSASVAQYEEHLCVLKCDFEMVPTALEYIKKNWLVPYKESIHQVKWFVESKRDCKCSLRHTRGLSCAHKIAPYKMANILLPIELIHDHWKRLSLLSPRNEGSMEDTLLAHFDCFYNKFLNEDQYDVKVNYVKKMQKLAYPKSSTLLEPKVNAQPLGQKSTKEKNAAQEQNSTRRDPSEFEHDLASLPLTCRNCWRNSFHFLYIANNNLEP
ncbi:hypothetical protein RHMOL_Rhmol13G0169900 [Rhododendron molle]|uniref:Uncharacterized protein n=1 Tax=Rhododendron molle TaxID=49168 RepID=A0ACC0L857_RHOML|nr:hypothetical protein RHMOL_Rhmol13G0169900 [Rhododendron molle]